MANTKIIIGDDTVQTLLLQEKDSLTLQDKLISLYPYDKEIEDKFPISGRNLQDIFGDKMPHCTWVNYALSRVQLTENVDYTKRTPENNPFDTVAYFTVSAAQKLTAAHNNKSLGLLVRTYLSWTIEQQHKTTTETALSLTQGDISFGDSTVTELLQQYNNAPELKEKLKAIFSVDSDTQEPFPINGRQLHDFLNVQTDYRKWFPRYQEHAGLIEGQDFRSKLSESTGGRPETYHMLTLDAAKELAMLQKSDLGRLVRRYLIWAEKRMRHYVTQQPVARIDPEFQTLLNETMTSIKTFVEQQAAIRDDVNNLQERVTKLEEGKRYLSVVKEADSYDPVTADGDISVSDMAVILKERGFDTGRQRLFDWLVKNKMIRKLKKGYVPLKKFTDLGVLSSEESEYETPAGIAVPYTKLLVTPKGKQYILERFTILASVS